MPAKGKIFTDKSTGDTFEFLETSKESGGKYSKISAILKPGGFKPVEHLHTIQDETFEVIRGKLTYILNGKKDVVLAGEKITLPMNNPHTHYNDEKEDLEIIQTVSPSYDSDYFLETIFGLAADGKLVKGSPGLLQILVLSKTLKTKTYLASIPVGVQAVLANILAPVGRLLGYKAVYKKYSGFDK